MCLFTQTTIETYFSKLLFPCSRLENAFADKILMLYKFIFLNMKVNKFLPDCLLQFLFNPCNVEVENLN